MQVVAIVLVAAIGVVTTCFAAVRMWSANRSGKPRELVLGYLALMLVASAVTMVTLRLM